MTKVFSQVRILPVTIFAATLMLTFRLGDLWDDREKISAIVQVGSAIAQTEEKKAERNSPEKDATIDVAETNANSKEGEVKSEKLGPADSIGVKTGSKPVVSASAVPKRIAAITSQDPAKLNKHDPTFLTPNEIELLQQLSERRDKLDKREQELNVREGLMQAAEVRIDNQIAELKKLEKMISSRLQTFDEQQLRKLQNLVRIYESMKPKDAAKIFEDLEMDTLLEVAGRMNSKKLAPVMAKMNPEKAREMTIELRVLGELPAFSGKLGG